jgi:hypothetical protein
VDCYFHNAVPSVAVCRDCMKTICATCRDEHGLCPSCRLDQRIKSAASGRPGISGGVGPSNPPPGPPPPGPPPSPPPGPNAGFWPAQPPRPGALAAVSPETRALVGLSYPMWPLAVLALLGSSGSPEVRRQALQALGFNFGCAGLYIGLGAVAHLPLLGISAWPLLIMLGPVWLVASIVFAVKAFSGEDVRVPLISEWLDRRDGRTMAI